MNKVSIVVCVVLCTGISLGDVSPAGMALDGLIRELSADSHERREEAVGALRKRLAGFEAEGRRKELAVEMGRLRRIMADANLGEDVRGRAKAVLEPFLSGGVLWSREKGDCLGTPYRAKAVDKNFLVMGMDDLDGVQEAERSWVALYSQTTGEAIWTLKGADLGMIPNFVEMIPGGILVGGLTLGEADEMGNRKRTGCVSLFDRETRKRVWSNGGFLTPLGSARVVHGTLIVSGGSVEDRPFTPWVAALSLTDGKTLWVKRDIPGAVHAVRLTGKGIAMGGYRYPDKKPGTIGGPCGWLALMDVKDGALVWSKRDIPGRVTGIEEIPGGILAIGERPCGKLSDGELTEGAKGGMLAAALWMGGYRFTDGQELWKRVQEKSDLNPPAFSAVPLKIVSTNANACKWKVLESGSSDWVRAYVDREGRLRPEPFDEGMMQIWALAALPEGFVAAGGDPMAMTCLVRRYAGSEKGFVQIWECKADRVDHLDATPYGILASNGRSNVPNNPGSDCRFSLIDPDTGKILWERSPDRSDQKAKLYAWEVCQDRVLVGGRLIRHTEIPNADEERVEVEGRPDMWIGAEREGFLRCYRLRDADAYSIFR